MHILLINPPHTTAIIREGRCQSPQSMRKTPVPQMTLAYLAGILQREGHTVKVIDCIAENIKSDILLKMVREFDPEIAFVNTTTPSINSDIEFIAHFKTQYPDCFMTAFGTHVTALHKEIMDQNLTVDCIIRNEPEWVAEELIAALEGGAITEKGIPGCTIKHEGRVIVGSERKFNSELDDLGFPAWEYFDIAKYLHPIFNKPYVMVNTSRGCVNNCIFCGRQMVKYFHTIPNSF